MSINQEGNRRALLDLLLAFEADDNNAGLSDQDIQEEIDTFMFEVLTVLFYYIVSLLPSNSFKGP